MLARVFLIFPLCFGVAWVTATYAQTTKSVVELLDGPEGKSTKVKVPSGAAVKIVKRQGFWVQLDVSGRIGWAKASEISFSGPMGGSTAIDTGRLTKGNIVSASAARGLSVKDLLNGKPDFGEVDKLNEIKVQAPEIQAFWAEGGLQTKTQRVQLAAPTARIKLDANMGSLGGVKATDESSPKKGKNEDW